MGFVYASAVPVDSYLSLDSKNRGIGEGPEESAELRRVEDLYQFDPIWLNQSVSESK